MCKSNKQFKKNNLYKQFKKQFKKKAINNLKKTNKNNLSACKKFKCMCKSRFSVIESNSCRHYIVHFEQLMKLYRYEFR